MGLYRRLIYPAISFIIMAVGFSDSVILVNDSPFQLTAMVIDAQGNIRGQTVLKPTQQLSFVIPMPSFQQPQVPMIPYTILWYCQDQTEYGIWTSVNSGALVTAQGSVGQKVCKFPKPSSSSSSTSKRD
jgi:hypothetical protein